MKSRLTKSGINAFLAPIRWIIVTGFVFFLSAGEIRIPRAWIYFGIYLIGSLVSGSVLMKKSPELLNARGKIQEGTKTLDKFLIFIYFIFAIIITPLVAGLDIRYKLCLFQFPYLYLGLTLYVLSAILSLWPMLHNPFFEGTVRIQHDRMHSVIKSGPYKIVRHPGYVGMLTGSLTLPFALGSVLSMVPALVMVILVIGRTYLEDITLCKELQGYTDYCKEVRYRLIPLIW